MANYIGFSTINANKPKTTNGLPTLDGGAGTTVNSVVSGKKYRLLDNQLVIRDFVNALNIPLGQKVGQPGYGTSMWSLIFEPNSPALSDQIESEIRRIASADPRIQLNYVRSYPQENGVLVEVEMAVTPFNQALVLNVFFNQATNVASVQ